jgi:PHD/YefM family antitoxin component YafN of YafNO toxin-antitoxin module
VWSLAGLVKYHAIRLIRAKLLNLKPTQAKTRARAVQTITANEAKTRFGEFLDLAQREPVRVLRHERVIGVLVSAQDFEDMRVFYANRLAQTLSQSAQSANLSQAQVDTLLADES